MNSNRQTKSNEARRLVVETLVIKLMNGCGLKSSPVYNVPWEICADAPYLKKKLRIRLKYQSECRFFTIDRNSIKNTPAVLWTEVFSDSIWLARVSDLRNFVNAIEPIKVVDEVEYYVKSELMAMFHRIDKMKIGELRNKIKELCLVTY